MGAWTDIQDDIPDFLEDNSDALIAKIPRIVWLAEKRISTECPIAGLHDESTVNTVAGTREIDRPSTAVAIRYVSLLIPGTGTRQLKARQSDWLLQYWPDVDATDVPKYWASFDAADLWLAPTPDEAYQVTIGYRKAPTTLSASQEDNEIGERHYDLFLWACCAIGATFLLDDRRAGMVQAFEARYAEAKTAMLMNERMRTTDHFSQTKADER